MSKPANQWKKERAKVINKEEPSNTPPKKKFLSKGSLILAYIIIYVVVIVLVAGAMTPFGGAEFIPFKVLVAMNVASFLLMGMDKTIATYENMTRIPERFFHIISLCGSAVGVTVGMYVFHHKTRKMKFFGITLAALVINAGLFALAWFGLGWQF